MSQRRFRLLLVGSVGAGLIGTLLVLTGDSLLPTALQSYLAQEAELNYASMSDFALVLAVVLSVITLVAAIGLFFFWSHARTLALVSVAAWFLLRPVLGPTVEPGIATTFNYAALFLWGSALAISYISPIAAHFNQKPNDAT